MAIPGALISGLAIYFICSYLFIPVKITIPISIIIFFLIFGLTKYYAVDRSSKTNGSIKTTDNNADTSNNDDDADNSNNKSKSNIKNINNTNESSSSFSHHIPLASILFVIGYIIALAIVAIGSFSSSTSLSSPNLGEIEALKLFVPWQQQFSSIDTIIKLGAAIALSFFLPGYALVSSFLLKEEKFEVITRNDNSDESSSAHDSMIKSEVKRRQLQPKRAPLLKALLSYILSVLITGLSGYIIASFGIPVSGINIILPLLVIYGIILVTFVFRMGLSASVSALLNKKYFNFSSGSTKTSSTSLLFSLSRKITSNDNKNNIRPEVILVFAALFALVILSTYYLYGGTIMGDQWFHHGRALMFISGTFRDIANSVQDNLYPPFLSAFLAAFISLSGNPSVNAYASISFLNIMPVLGFYYFFTRWVPDKWRNAALLASALFVLSGGFGWVYAISTAISSSSVLHHPAITSYASSLDVLTLASVKTFDIVAPSAFLLVSHPDFSTGMQLIVLPVGFVLLGLMKELRRAKEMRNEREKEKEHNEEKGNEKKQKHKHYHKRQQTNNHNEKDTSNIKYFVIVTIISLLGVLSHDEIYLFVIILSTIPIIFDLPKKHFVYAGFLAAITITFLINHVYAEDYYTSTLIVGVPLLYLSFLFVGLTWAIYASKIYFSKFFSTRKIGYRINNLLAIYKLKRFFSYNSSSLFHTRFRIRIALAILMPLLVSYWYIFTFMFWTEIPVKEVRLQTSGSDLNIPWYLFPMKLGVTGLIGLTFVLSYLFKKFEKELFVFGLIAMIAFFAGPYYDEQRFSKYIMLGMAGFASILIYKIITKIMTKKESSSSFAQTHNLTNLISDNINNNSNNSNNTRANSIDHHKTLVCGLILGSVITLSSLSVLLYMGYHASALLTHNFRLAEPGTDFPSPSEFNMFRFINNHLTDVKTYNIALMPKAYVLQSGLTVNKIQGFIGIPVTVLVTDPLTLNSSSLEGFYNLLKKSNTRYIIVPSEIAAINGIGEGAGDQGSMNVLHFALKNFQRVYRDENYVVLALPSSLTGPLSTGGDVALVYQKGGSLPLSNFNINNSLYDDMSVNEDNNKVLSYDKHSFHKIDSFRFIKINKGTKTAVLYGNKSQTVWSNPVNQKGEDVSYIEGTFRIIEKNKTKANTDCGIVWDDGINKYYTRITEGKLQFSQTNLKDSFTFQDQGIKKENLIWYKIKILFIPKSTVNIYIDDLLKLRIPNPPVLPENDNSTGHNFKAGIRCSGDIGEFEPLQIGLIPNQVSGRQQQSGENQDYDKRIYNYFYALNTLALSKTGYASFLQDDYSAFSKRNIILTSDAVDQEGLARYLEYAKAGGTLIVINSDNNNVNGSFGKLLGIQAGGNASKFNAIGGLPVIQRLPNQPYSQGQHYLRVSGTIKDIQFKESPDVKVLSSYLNHDNQSVAKFAIEKDYDGGGRIIFVNAVGYFDAISKDPYQYFATLSNFPSLIALNSSKYAREDSPHPAGSITTARYIGNATIIGQTIINSSSVSLSDPSVVGSYNLYAKGISISSDHKGINYDYKNTVVTNTSALNSQTHPQSKDVNTVGSEYIPLKNLKVFGPYQVIINSIGLVYLPSWLSYNDYISISVPPEFNMTLKLLRGASVEFVTTAGLENNTPRHVIINNNYSSSSIHTIQFYRINTDIPQVKNIPVLMKSPEIEATGNISFGRLYLDFSDYDSQQGIRGSPVQINGKLSAKVEQADHFDTSRKRTYTKDYLTYFEWFKTDEKTETKTPIQDKLFNLRIPGDISYVAKQASSPIRWQQIAGSNISILVILSLLIITSITTWLLWPRRTKESWNYKIDDY